MSNVPGAVMFGQALRRQNLPDLETE